jgi:hypothetical protein
MIRIINNTDIAVSRLLVLYAKEIASVNKLSIESIVFNPMRIAIYGIDSILLEKNDDNDILL